MRFSDNAELTAANMTGADILAGTDVSSGDDKKFTLNGLGEWFVESYTGSTIDGQEQTPKAAIEAAGNKFIEYLPTDTASGAIASFPDGAEGLKLKSLILDIKPFQAGSGDPSPDNVRPISGHTDVVVTRTGKNLLPNKKAISSNIVFLGTDTIDPNEVYTHCITLPAGEYSISVETSDQTTTNLYVAEVGENSYFARATNAKRLTFSINDTTDLRIWAYKSGYSSIGVGAITQLQLEVGSSATTYEPYSGTTIPITWSDEAGTVYGGTVDVTNGALRATAEKLTLNGSEGYWSGVATSNGVLQAYTDLSFQNRELLMCDSLKIWTNNTTLNIIRIDSGRLVVTPQWAQSAANINDFKTLLASNNINIVRTPTTPQTYQLTPQQVNSLLGQNNIWNTAGDTEVEYYADTKLYINKIVAALA